MRENPRSFVDVTAGKIDADGRSWIEVMPTAEKARNGRWYFTITTADLEALVAYVSDNPGKIPVDRDHKGAEGDTRAAGWFTGEALLVKAGETNPDGDKQTRDSAWAQVEWTPTAAQEIRDGEFKFISPEWRMARHDAKTGLGTKLTALIAATLTNRPFFRELAPVGSEDDPYFIEDGRLTALHRLHGDDVAETLRALATDPNDSPARARARAAIEAIDISTERTPVNPETLKLLGLADDATDEQITEKIAELKAAAAKEPEPAPDPKEHEMDTKTLAAALKLADDADDAAILAGIKQLQETVETTTGLSAEALEKFQALAIRGVEADRQLAELKAQAEKRLHESERDALLAKAVEEGRILPVHKEPLAAMYDLDPAACKAMVEASPKRAFREVGSNEPGPGDRPAPRVMTDKVGNVIAAVEDPDWLDNQAQAILRAKGKTLRNATPDEYAEALEEATLTARS